MSKYVLNNVALRTWWLVPRALITDIRGEHRGIRSLSREAFEQLKKCDGLCDLEETQLTRSLLEKQWIRPAKEGETTDPYLLHRSYDNRYVLNMGINITERCNFNCLHCYEAVDNEILREEMSLENCRKLLEEAASCGIQNIKITGGEPLMHPDFMEIVRCVYQNDMTVDRINTNGFFLTPELLDELRSLDPHILFNISYDGAGYHDWMRGRKGAEDDLLKKIRLLVDKGFQVRAAMTLNRVNRDAAAQTMNRMEELGVQEFRIIRTSETPRWVLNAGDACMTMEEYYDCALELCREYASSEHRMNLNIWHFVKVFSGIKRYAMAPVLCAREDYRPDMVICGNARDNLTITPGGGVYPCTPSPGLYKSFGMEFGNVFETGLKRILQDGPYLSFVCKGVHAIAEHDTKCGSCPYFRQCMGGCRLFALALNGDVMSHDPTKCIFYEKQYYNRLRDALPGYSCVNEVKEEVYGSGK